MLNRSALFERIERVNAENSGLAAVLFIDLDNFKSINDTYGHLVGYNILRVTAGRLASACEAETILGRIGGDEFVAAVFNESPLGDPRRTERVVAAMNDAVAPPITMFGADITVSISICVAYNHGHSTLEDLLTETDFALYETKSDVRRSCAPNHAPDD